MYSVSPSRLHTSIHRISATVSVLCIPLVPFSSSLYPPFMWFGRAAIMLALACSVASLRINHRDLLSPAILVAAVAMICVGFIGDGSGNPQQYVQIAQLLIVGVLLSAQKRMVSPPALDWALLATIAVMIFINLAFPVSAVQDATHKFMDSVTVGVFGNPNTLAIYWLLLFMLAAPMVWRAGGVIRIVATLFCVALFYLAAITESRGVLITFLAYVMVLGIGLALNGHRDALRFVGAAALVGVPFVLIAYPTVMGLKVRFRLPPPARVQLAQQDTKVERIKDAPLLLDNAVCVTSTFQKCGAPVVQAPPPVKPIIAEDSGMFGIHKKFASGRETIWAATIELSGENMAFGRGLGTLPGAYLAPPYSGRSAHNGFLQVYFQFGLVGLALYFTIWALLIVRAARIPNVITRCSTIAVIVAACITETFEVMMIQNQIGTGVAFALLITTRMFPVHSEVSD